MIPNGHFFFLPFFFLPFFFLFGVVLSMQATLEINLHSSLFFFQSLELQSKSSAVSEQLSWFILLVEWNLMAISSSLALFRVCQYSSSSSAVLEQFYQSHPLHKLIFTRIYFFQSLRSVSEQLQSESSAVSEQLSWFNSLVESSFIPISSSLALFRVFQYSEQFQCNFKAVLSIQFTS